MHLPALVGGEVRAHPLAQVGGLAHVEHLAPRRRRRGTRRAQRGRCVVSRSLAACGWASMRGRASRSSRPSTPKLAARSSRRWSRSVVASASSSARWVGRWSSRKRLASVPSRQLGTSSRTSRRASAAVSTSEWASRGQPSRSSAAFRKPASKRTLWPTSTVPAANSTNAGSTASTRGAGTTMAWVMPVSRVISGGMARPGFTSVWKVPSTSPPRTLTAPISVMRVVLGRRPGGLEVDHAERDVRAAACRDRRSCAARRRTLGRTDVRRKDVPAARSTGLATPLLAWRHGCHPLPLHGVRQPDPVRRRHHPPVAGLPPLQRRAASWPSRTKRCSPRASRRSRAGGAARPARWRPWPSRRQRGERT